MKFLIWEYEMERNLIIDQSIAVVKIGENEDQDKYVVT
jgi:hypothetical protein